MTKQAWLTHVQATTGATPPSLGGNLEAWREALRQHGTATCPECRKRVATAKANNRRKAMDQVRRDCGLVRGRDSMGRTLWE